MSYRNDVDALAARHAALEAEAAEITKRRDETRQLLDEARAKARLPVLANIRVASPCSEPWTGMTGDDRVRACAKCQKDVYNLSAMTRDEAEGLIRARNGNLCVRYFQRFDGTILLGDCEVGRNGKRKRRFIAAGIAAGLAAGVSAYGVHATSKHDDGQFIAGAMEAPPMMVQGGMSSSDFGDNQSAAPPPTDTEAPAPQQRVPMKL
jgi:hypothetical protein